MLNNFAFIGSSLLVFEGPVTAPLKTHAAPAPVIEYVAPEPKVGNITPAPVYDNVAPAPEGLALPPCTCARARRIDTTAVFFWCAMCGTASEHGQCQCASVVTVHEPVHVKDLRENFFPSDCCCESNSPLPAAWRPRTGSWRQAQLNPHESPTYLCSGG